MPKVTEAECFEIVVTAGEGTMLWLGCGNLDDIEPPDDLGDEPDDVMICLAPCDMDCQTGR